MAKCLIAGLPAAGKSTYIGALAYLLQNPVNNQILKLCETPDDLSYLNKLIDPWLSLQKMERTTRGFANNIDLELVRVTDGKTFSLSLPDIAGEDYESIVHQNAEVIKNWAEELDSLLLFINDWKDCYLKEQLGDTEPANRTKEPPIFSIKDMSTIVQNVLILKELHILFPWKKLAIGLSSWDKFSQEYTSPVKMLEQRAPFLHNFVMHYFPDVYIFGVSAQGDEYVEDEEAQSKLLEKTENGTRAFIVDKDGVKSYDLTLPLNFIISD